MKLRLSSRLAFAGNITECQTSVNDFFRTVTACVHCKITTTVAILRLSEPIPCVLVTIVSFFQAKGVNGPSLIGHKSTGIVSAILRKPDRLLRKPDRLRFGLGSARDGLTLRNY